MRKASLILLLCAVFIQGCAPSTAGTGAGITAGSLAYGVYTFLKPEIPKILNAAAAEATILGLKSFADQSSGKTAVGDLVKATDDALIYLQSGNLPTADIVNQMVSAKFSNLSPNIMNQIAKVEGTISKYIPSASVVLTNEQIGYLVAFLQGVHDASQTWLGNQNVSVAAKYTLTTNKDMAKKKADLYPAWFKAKEKLVPVGQPGQVLH